MVNECTFYAEQHDWLPESYIESAICACKGRRGKFFPFSLQDDTLRHSSGDPGWVGPAANCVRRQLLMSHEALKRTNTALVQKMKDQKQKHCNDVYCAPEYIQFIFTEFVPIVYAIHEAAYGACGCRHSVAPLITW